MPENIIDMHVHFGAPSDPISGCYWSEEFEQTAAYYAMRLLTNSLFKEINIEKIKNQLFETVNESQYVKKCVVLSMDEVYDETGAKHREWTHLFVPNSYVYQLNLENERILFGCSVHPYRSDWQQELDNCLQRNAVLCKWIPSSQQIDPSHKKCKLFYEKLAESRLPLLCHAGPEYAIPTSNQQFIRFNNPKYLRNALETGVPVIVAHCALPYFWFFDAEYEEHFQEFLKLVEEAEKKNWNLYADISAIATPLRAPYIKKILDTVSPHRLLFGSDYPIPLSELTYNRSRNIFAWIRFVLKTMFVQNHLDKNYLILQKMGFDPTVFSNAERLFSDIRYSPA